MTLRQAGGVSGFSMRSESQYDVFGAGHASTSDLGGAGHGQGARLAGRDEAVVAVLGDGALTGGLAYEALNNAGGLDTNFIVVLNDNEMSIAPNVGAIDAISGRCGRGRSTRRPARRRRGCSTASPSATPSAAR